MTEIHVIGVNRDSKDDPRLEYDNVIGVPEIFIDSWNSTKPYQIWKGSRYSAKSWTKALQLLLKVHTQEYCRVVFARNTQKACRDSQFQLFKDTLKRNKILAALFTINETTMTITHVKNGNFLRGGSFEQPESLMSVPDVTDFWAEEPITRKVSINRQDFQDIAGTLRNPYGIPPIFHFTFNPMSKKNFIYEDFFDPDKKAYQAEVVTANYYHNPFCPDDRIEFLDQMKIIDPDRWAVDGDGKWGIERTGGEWAINFKRAIHVQPCYYDPDLPIHVSFDFNSKPYMSATVNQIREEGDRIQFLTIMEVALSHPLNTTNDVCNYIIAKLDPYGISRIFYYGDASGRNKQARKTRYEDLHHYETIARIFKPYTYSRSDRTMPYNPSLMKRRDFYVTLLAGVLNIDVIIDPSCEETIADFEECKEDSNGGILKPKVKDDTGATYEPRGHHLDSHQYCTIVVFKKEFEAS